MYRFLTAVLLLACCLTAPATAAPSDSLSTVPERLQRLSPLEIDEVVWLARCLYSESNRQDEQRLVAWVVRNRVETGYRGATYRQVVLEDKQFSAFNEPTSRRAHLLSLDEHTTSLHWRRTLDVALDVYHAGAAERPFPITVRHFYSPVSMKGGKTPTWAEGETPLSSLALGVNKKRFLFFDDLDTPAEGGSGSSRSLAPGRVPVAAVSASPAPRRLKLSRSLRRPQRPNVSRPRGNR